MSGRLRPGFGALASRTIRVRMHSIMGRTVALVGLASLAGVDAPPADAASDCPSAVSGKGSYVVERRGVSTTEVSYGDDHLVHTKLKVGGRTLLETTLYEGLFELDRLDRGTKIQSKPKDDLAGFFPLKPKQAISASFDVTTVGAGSKIMAVKLRYVGTQDYAIGGCSYTVLKLQRNQTYPILFDNVDYYAPELKLVVAKQYREGGGRTSIVGYDRISSSPGR